MNPEMGMSIDIHAYEPVRKEPTGPKRTVIDGGKRNPSENKTYQQIKKPVPGIQQQRTADGLLRKTVESFGKQQDTEAVRKTLAPSEEKREQEKKVVHAEDIFVAKRTEKTGDVKLDDQKKEQAGNRTHDTKTQGRDMVDEYNDLPKAQKRDELQEEQQAMQTMLEQNEQLQGIYEQFAVLGNARIDRMREMLEKILQESENPEEQENANLLLMFLELIRAVLAPITKDPMAGQAA